MKSVAFVGLVSLGFMSIGAAHAEPWSGDAALGFLASSGNSDSTSSNARIAIDYTRPQWKNAFAASAITASSSDETTTERYTAADQLDWNLSPRNFIFGNVEFEKDLYGGFRERYSETVGYGRHVLTGPTHLLDATIGAGARQTQEQETREREQEFIQRGELKYTWNFSETGSASTGLVVETGPENTFTESVNELKFAMIGSVSAVVGFTARNNSDVPPGTEKTDTFTSVSLSYAFGKKKSEG